MEHENEIETAEIRNFLIQNLHLKVDSYQQEASSSGIPPWEADSINQP
jgi:hypothetical protein